MRRMLLMEAAELARLSYDGAAALPPLKAMNLKGGAQAYLTQDDVLVIPGTNEARDWADYNLKAFPAKGAQVGWAGIDRTIETATWHFGFALHALHVMIFLGTRRPAFIIGHSLGAASAQILGLHFGVPTVCFASPRPIRGDGMLNGEGWVLNLVHVDDIIGMVLGEGAGYRRIGSVRGLTPDTAGGIAHRMADYKVALAGRIAAGSLPPHWPPLGG